MGTRFEMRLLSGGMGWNEGALLLSLYIVRWARGQI